MSATANKRPYRSELREDMSRETRRRIRTAASQLFTEDGYVATTVDAIAQRAKVSRRTVFNAFGSKAGLVMEMFLSEARGEDEPEPRQLEQLINAGRHIDDPTDLIAFVASAAADIASRAIEMWRVAQEAARVDPEVAALLQAQEEGRYRSSLLVHLLAGRGSLRTDIPTEVLRRGTWLLTGPAIASTALSTGLTPDEYRLWLTECLTGLLLSK